MTCHACFYLPLPYSYRCKEKILIVNSRILHGFMLHHNDYCIEVLCRHKTIKIYSSCCHINDPHFMFYYYNTLENNA